METHDPRAHIDDYAWRMDASMTAYQYRHIIARLGLSQIAAARPLGVDERISRRWANEERDIPAPAVRFLQYLIATKKTGEQATRILDAYTQLRGW